MPKVARERKEERRAHILNSAKACFSKNGFHKTTMRDILKSSRLSSGAVYGYFKSKEEIIKAIAMQTLEANLAFLDGVKGMGDAKVQLDSLAAHFFGLLEKPEGKYISVDIELWGEAQRNGKIKRILSKSMMAHHYELSKILVRAKKNGEIDPAADPDSVASALIALFQGFIIQMKIAPKADLWRYVETVKMMLAGLMTANKRGRR
jgi:AcrR family transcriptional regulator